MTRQRRNQQGAALAYVAIFLAVILGATAVGIDVARLAHTAAEVQAVADAAARAGAKALLDEGGDPGVGITRAHDVAGLNLMDGTAAPAGDVKVDEGFYNSTNKKFECCQTGGAYNSPCCADEWANHCTQTVTVGDCDDSRSAVVAVPHATVNNLFAGIFDFMSDGRIGATANGSANKHTKVEKIAIAGASGPAAGCRQPEECAANDWACYCSHGVAPCLPIAVPSCEFQPPSCNGVDCTLPTDLTVSSAKSDTAGWTGFDQNANDSNVRKILRHGPCGTGAGDPIDAQSLEPNITLNNGLSGASEKQVFGLVACLAGLRTCKKDEGVICTSDAQCPGGGNKCLNSTPQGCGYDATTHKITAGPGPVFTIPVFKACSSTCTDNFNNSCTHPIVGFATIRVTAVSTGSPRTISIDTLRNDADTDAPSGGACVGTDCDVALVK